MMIVATGQLEHAATLSETPERQNIDLRSGLTGRRCASHANIPARSEARLAIPFPIRDPVGRMRFSLFPIYIHLMRATPDLAARDSARVL